MMGIRSKQLYDRLSTIVIDKDLSIFNEIPSSEFLPELCMHFSETIPKDIFEYEEDSHEDLFRRLKELSEYLEAKFAKRDKYPFTIQRICELSYHPLEYFRVDALGKFVSALEKCCFVNTDWTLKLGEVSPNTDPLEDVSLVPIDWPETNKEGSQSLGNLLAKIEAIVAVNFGFDDFEDEDEDDGEDEDGDGNARHSYGNNKRDVLIERYEEFDDDDYEHDDEEYNDEESTSSDSSDDDDDKDGGEEQSHDQGKKNEEVGTYSIEFSKSIDGVQTESSSIEDVIEDDNESVLSRKRNVTELDDYQYNEVKEGTRLITTPKKSKVPANELGSDVVSPVVSNQENATTTSTNDAARINELGSPETSTSEVTQSEKNELSTSPLHDRTRS